MKAPTTIKALTNICVVTFLIVLSASPGVRAQDTSNWTEQSPEGEAFKVTMPPIISVTPRSYQFGGLSVSGKLYTATHGSGSYRIWSLEDAARTNSTQADTDAYLDACADLVWESLLKADREKIEKNRHRFGRMHYRRELLLGTTAAGREYSITLDITQGLVHFYSHQNRLYVLVVTVPAFVSAQEEQFLKSFTLLNQKPATIDADPMLFPPDDRPIPYGDPNYNRVFSPREVTEKARIIYKPEPQYTEAARQYGVSGTVVIRAVFSATGEVKDIRVVRKLPHGMTEQSIIAVRGIRFQPAQKDGRPVSQYIQIEYNYNLY
jgi:TonB family protein